MKYLSLQLILSVVLSTQLAFGQDRTVTVEEKEKLVIAFGSCNKQYRPQPLWKDILAHEPDLFLFLGDNIYGDTNNMRILEDKYEKQNQQPDYTKLKKQTEIIGVWDDHDYGKNDAGKEYSHKEESQQLFLDFFEVPENSPRRKREGVYSSYQLNWNDQKIKIILLDARYHRDDIIKTNNKYILNEKGTILGKEQWSWLGNEISDSLVDLYIIASGIQFIAEDHPYEKWANFPNERKKMFNLIADKNPKGVIFLSGDRHIAEISTIDWRNLPYPLVDITSSGLTHTWSGDDAEEYNQHREGELIAQLNYGLLEISAGSKGEIKVVSQIRGEDQQLYLEKEMVFNN
ncbi:alkaline phosphatase family protein [Marivirga sp. S37H4]|uniref:Alkaline phosphatase family protein n=1 Tax=Marivirga aurantiaca TaxID=2802615 RepID=A0A935C9Q4_9BACT|nr:alkaline phosphatase D family protein [Marivirga aurantiaca]MBK6266170.1 alkaline phosphatase family protein [Marivirga aurantiaca]